MAIRSRRWAVLLMGLALLAATTHAEDGESTDDHDDHYADEEGLRVPHLLGWGVRVGVANSPDVVVGGINLDMGGIARRVRAEPSFEVGIGDDRTTFSATAALHYILRPRRTVRPYVGAGASLGLDYSDPPDRGGDLDLRFTVRAVGGSSWVLRNRKEFFLEGALILGALHNVQFVAGWRF